MADVVAIKVAEFGVLEFGISQFCIGFWSLIFVWSDSNLVIYINIYVCLYLFVFKLFKQYNIC